ncbi:hypothetical protein FT663_01097 [Candidozyma haemuli var. vulneris]|nr:hypothetical protein FT662_00397 [[Candida] haemuloni var. vulneris]KAF3994741.1 hypothetical protein FT663_01097 [[Candida] haemuloni var. vulneris]
MSKVELLYAKSKAYLHPSSSNKDNVPGFVSLSRPSGPSTNKDILLSYTPENMLSAEELKVYKEVDMAECVIDSMGKLSLETPKKAKDINRSVRRPPQSSGAGYCFSLPLQLVYMIQVRLPSLGWWYGSVILHTKTGEKMPAVFFHDDESPSTLERQKLMNKSFDPFGEDGQMFWGGQDLIKNLRRYINVEKSTVEPSAYLVDPSSSDLANFAPLKEQKKEKQEPFKLPDVNKMFATAKWRVLETVASFGQKTKNSVVDMVDDHVPEVVVKSVLSKPEVKKISNDFDSARVYLAKWAAQVKEEAENSQRKFMLEDSVYNRINKELRDGSEILTPEEISNASRRKPISKVEWDGFFDHKGRLTLTVDEVKFRIFHGGLEEETRKEAWLFLLGVYPWDSSAADRKTLRESLETSYHDYKKRWVDDEEKRQDPFWKDQKLRIEKDIHRNDRHLPLFQRKKPDVPNLSAHIADSFDAGAADTRESSPETPDEDEEESEWDLAHIENPHLFAMREILLTFNEYNVNLGYVQGMTDLLSPIYVILQDEVLSFWAFSGFMERMERNFVRDQSGMKHQMDVLNGLLQFMLPDLFKHLEKCESTDLFFFFRMLLVWYKREFEWDDVLTLWEVLFTDYYSSQFHLFFALSVLSDNKRIIMQNLRRFDEVLKYMNELSGKMKLNDLLTRAELLFLRFKRMIALIDRENSQRHEGGDLYEVNVNPDLRELLSRKLVIQKEVERPEGVGGG